MDRYSGSGKKIHGELQYIGTKTTASMGKTINPPDGREGSEGKFVGYSKGKAGSSADGEDGRSNKVR